GIKVLARPARVPRLRVTSPEDREVVLRVDDGRLPHRAAAISGARAPGLRPGVGARLARPRNDRPLPESAAVLGVEGLHAVARAAEVAAAVARDHHPVDVDGSVRDPAALLP